MELYGRQTNIEDVQVRPSKPIKLRDERQITVWVVAVLVLLLIAVGLAVWWLNGGGFDFKSASRGAQSPPVSARAGARGGLRACGLRALVSRERSGQPAARGRHDPSPRAGPGRACAAQRPCRPPP